MSLDCRDAGIRRTLTQRWKSILASTAFAAAVGLGAYFSSDVPAFSGGETRTISIYHVHTKESLTITYKKDGKYIPSAMKKLNYILRDWRRNEVIAISPKTIDLMWELHADLGSKRPVHIVSGYRSPKTNAFLKKIGRNVARKSQHMIGKAIDIYFPDIPTERMRNSALVRQVGGVGYYRSGGGPTGFLHIDSGRVRHWGPAISSSQMARIMRDYRKTVGARINKKGMVPVPEVQVAEADTNASFLPSQQDGKSTSAKKLKDKKPPVESAYTEDDEELAGMSEDASTPPPRPRLKAVPETADPEETAQTQPEVVAASDVPEGVVKGYPVPKPRPKPIEVLMMAAVNMKIVPASAPPPSWNGRDKTGPVSGESMGVVEAAETMAETTSNIEAKGSLVEEIRNGNSSGVPVIKTITASAGSDDLFWWPQQLVFDSDKAVRRDGAPQQFGESLASLLPGIDDAQADTTSSLPPLAVASISQAPAAGKGDMLVVNREGKGSLMMNAPVLKKKLKLGMAEGN
jgi:uncharacterized protein YcbK (DUF882 family)